MIKTQVWKYSIGDVFSDSKRKIQLIAKEERLHEYNSKTRKGIVIPRIRHQKWYKYKCLICSWEEGWMREADITKGVGCACCKGFSVVKGINDFGTKCPDKIKYFIDRNDAFKYTSTSGKIVHLKCPKCGLSKDMRVRNLYSHGFRCEYCNALPNVRPDLINFFVKQDEMWNYSIGSPNKVELQCPDCGFIKIMSVHSLCTDGFSCPKCSDGISYPEKFMISVLEQLGINFIYQYSKTHAVWCENYRYDFYLTDFNYIIEVHGNQHYQENTQFQNCTLNEVKKNDERKMILALQNGISKYIQIPARKSRLEVMKKSVIKSLSPFFDLSKVIWTKCGETASRSIIKKVCEYYKQYANKTGNIDDMCKKFHISDSTLRIYLHIGTENNWCNYIPRTMSKYPNEKIKVVEVVQK